MNINEKWGISEGAFSLLPSLHSGCSLYPDGFYPLGFIFTIPTRKWIIWHIIAVFEMGICHVMSHESSIDCPLLAGHHLNWIFSAPCRCLYQVLSVLAVLILYVNMTSREVFVGWVAFDKLWLQNLVGSEVMNALVSLTWCIISRRNDDCCR